MPNSSRDKSLQDLARALLNTSVFCLAVTVFLWLFELGDSFWRTAVVSFCIGWGICLAFHYLEAAADRLLPTYLTPVPLVAVGLAAGLLLAGLLVAGSPLLFFRDNYYTLLIGVFFGLTGFSVINVRNRLAEAETALARAEAQRQQQDRLVLETELKLLQAQIEPHFLFNTLSHIVGLIHSDPDRAEQTLLHLTTLLRASLRRTRSASITLGEELQIVRAYLEIQSTRMSGRLTYSLEPPGLENDPELRDWRLPPLLLQPLVENAVMHGIDPLEDGGTLTVSARQENGRLQLSVIDTGRGMPSDSAPGTGLSNIRARLEGLYGQAASLRISDNPPGGLRVDMELPAGKT